MQFQERLVIDGTRHFMNVRHVTLRGTNFEIGKSLAQIAQERHGATPRTFSTADATFARARRTYFRQSTPIHAERMRGMAAAFGLAPDDDAYDISELWYNLDVPVMPPVGCSVVYYPAAQTESGHTVLSRNYDFVTSTLPEMIGMPLPPESSARLRPIMGDPYLMEFYPEDGGYASLAIHSFDLLAGVLDGFNSAGLTVAIMADEEALPLSQERHIGPAHYVGLHELQVMRELLDTCAGVDEAKHKLLALRQYYRMIPCHYIIGDRHGNSFIYENSTGRNFQHIIEGGGRVQPVTNFQVHRHPTRDKQPAGPLALETNAFWRYQCLEDSLSPGAGRYSVEQIKEANARVAVQKLIEVMSADGDVRSIAAGVHARTLWHSLYDVEAGAVDFCFYLGETPHEDGTWQEHRSDYLRFALDRAWMHPANSPQLEGNGQVC